jgi:hypothetical protein
MHYYERNIVEIKIEYTNFLINIMAPLVYEGIKSMYDKAIEVEKETEQAVLQGVVNDNPGVLKIFQHFLKNIQTLNSQLIEAEYIRIRDSSKHADIFEKLIKATFKSYIVLLTYNASGKECKLINEKYHDKINIKDFIHKVYVESSKILFLNPELFWHQFPTIEQQKNKRETISIIKEAIKEALIKVLPLNDIITDYLKNDYIIETDEMKENKVRQILIEEDQVEDKHNINFFDDNEQLKDDQKDELMDKLNKSVSKLDVIIDDNTKALEENEFNEKMNKFASLDFNGDKKKIHNEQPQIEQKQPQIEQKQPQIEQKQPQIEQKQPQIEQDINEIKILKSNINEKEYYDALFM